MIGTVLLGAMVAAQVVSGAIDDLRGWTGLVVLLLAASSVAFAAGATGRPGRAVAAFGAVVAVGYAAELAGVATGVPFGAYSYTQVLQPQVLGVPVIVPVAWGGMGLAAYAIAPGGGGARLPGRGAAHVPGRGAARVLLGAVALTAWDLFLDPQMLRLGAWTWHDGGFYRGVPLSNFAGWLLVSLVVMAVIHGLLPEVSGTAGPAAVYAVMAVMETVGFALVFRPPDLLVAVCGGVAMGVFVAVRVAARAGAGARTGIEEDVWRR
ncbi:carotenoid biosynthesis protein [Nonomuraea sp. SMC257]|uniref:Carotenoid biosynthesis protein n=1 Tax=Nonomuraea montanisoli TaxID=2741721 RepID=A0A7Y6I3S3_9ACTN|nr:carotenoid biosynthesis protein [Nonomuraea montanisoli]